MANTQVIRGVNGYTATPTGWALSSGSAATALGDSSDVTYVSERLNSRTLIVPLETFTLPDGALLSDITYAMRSSRSTLGSWHVGLAQTKTASGGFASSSYQVGAGGAEPANTWRIKQFTGLAPVSVSNPGTSQTVLDAAEFRFVFPTDGPAGSNAQIAEVWATVTYLTPPKISSLAFDPPDAASRTTRPNFVWVNPSGGGADEPMTGWELVIWPLSAVTGFAGGRAAFESSGEAFSGAGHTYRATAGTTDNSHTPTADLVNGTAYVAYIKARGQALGSNIETIQHNASLDFTIAITPPANPSSVVAAGLNTQRMYRSINVGYTNQAAPVGIAATRRVEVQRRKVGTTTWWPLAKSPFAISWGASGTLGATDDLWAPGATYEYRARITGAGTDGQRSSAWVQASGTFPFDLPNQWSLRAVTDKNNLFVEPVFMGIDGDLVVRSEQAQGVFRPLGSKYAIVVSEPYAGPESFELSVRVDAAGLARLQALREPVAANNWARASAHLQLLGDMTGFWRWVKITSLVEVTYPRAANRKDDAKRIHGVRIGLVEVRAPYLLPNPDEE